ncbi:hypothetical protein CRE_05070 [Caenorhabditis remanei]|uniref:Helitron helicase-like domain-containing protein n=1 Tax=Caenorhabditis remanei TaxID=31234 RepID=E3MZ16_CAERE|nr:hypothetical protein CRE_05070 [Caenorhabditis remanei]
MYPMVDRTNAAVDIPFVSATHSVQKTSESYEKKNRRTIDGTDNYDDFDPDSFQNIDIDQEEDLAASEIDTVEMFYEDEHDAEPSALGRKNDGVKVQNVGQREFQRECKRLGVTWAEGIPTPVNTVFRAKFEILLKDVIGLKKKNFSRKGKQSNLKGMFGKLLWWVYSVEFQQRGMHHVHMLLSLKEHITNAAQVDKMILAEFPELPLSSDPDYEEVCCFLTFLNSLYNYFQKLCYYELVKSLMVHFPCRDDPTAYCKDGAKSHWNKCTKGFTNKFSDSTVLTDNQYPDYKRTKSNQFTMYWNGKEIKAGSDCFTIY